MTDQKAKHSEPEHAGKKEADLSFGRFALQQIRTLAFTFGGLAAGAAIGFGVNKYMKGKVPEFITKHGGTLKEMGGHIYTAVGSMVGLLIGGVFSNYEHWAKVTSERDAVNEIDKDVAQLMQRRIAAEQKLEAQHAKLDQVIDTVEKSHAAGIESKSHTLHAARAKAMNEGENKWANAREEALAGTPQTMQL